MTLSNRDRQITRYVAVFGQLTASHIRRLVFADLASPTPTTRALHRLVTSGHLARVERQRLVGGAKGGAGQYVYTLGRRGYQLYFDGTWRPQRNVNYHNLLVADSFLAIKQTASNGLLSVDYSATGDDAAAKVGSVELRPDLRIDVTLSDGRTLMRWLEIDMATEGKKQIKDKLARYWMAANTHDPEWPRIPRVIWVACDEERAKELRWIIDQGGDDGQRDYFQVTVLEGLADVLR
jgi:hypothetical protein